MESPSKSFQILPTDHPLIFWRLFHCLLNQVLYKHKLSHILPDHSFHLQNTLKQNIPAQFLLLHCKSYMSDDPLVLY